MGILDSIVEWVATQIMNLLDMITGSVLGALGCDMSTFLRYFPAAETLYEVFVAIAVGFILLNLVWQLFKNFGAGIGLSAEDPAKLLLRSILFIFLALFADEIMALVLDIVGTPYSWIVDTSLPPIEFASFGSVLTVIVGCLASGSVSLIVIILVIIIAWNYLKLLFEAAHAVLEEIKAFLTEQGWGGDYELIFSGQSLLELTARGANKGGMVRRLAARLGISMEHVYCVGDEANDIPMLTAAAEGFAPANCVEAVRKCGATIVADARESALADVIRRLGEKYPG